MNDMNASVNVQTCRTRRVVGVVVAAALCVVLSGCGHSITVSGVDSERVGWAISEVLRDEGISHNAGRGHCEWQGGNGTLFGSRRVETNIHETGGRTTVVLAGYPEFEVVRSSDPRLVNHVPIPANNAGRVLLTGVSREDVQRSLEFWTPLSPGYGSEPMVFNVAGSAVREERRGWLDPRVVHWQVTLRSEGDATLLTVNGCETKLPSVSAIENVPADERFTDAQREEWMARVVQRLRKTHPDLQVTAYEPPEE